MSELVLVAALCVAFVNGANDNMKGVATLYAADVLPYRRALTLATASTALGSLASLALAEGLARAFSGKGIVPDAALEPALLACVALAAAATVLLATLFGLPVSTTHVSTGAIIGIGRGGRLDWRTVGRVVAAWLVTLPLGALLAAVAVWALR